MSEIRLDVDLEHPPERVWRALTEDRLLAQWLDLPGFDPVSELEVTGLEEPRRVAMLWGNDDLHTRLTWELSETSNGCQLLLRQTCVYGEWDDEQRETLRDVWESVLDERLPAALDWLAFGEVDLLGDPDPDTEPAVAGVDEPTVLAPTVAPRRRSGRRTLVAVLAVLAVATGATLILLVRPGKDDPIASTTPAAEESSTTAPAATASAGAGRAEAASAPSPTPTPSPTSRAESATTRPAPQAKLGAQYETVSTRILGYRGEVTLKNTGDATAQGWQVTITLREGATVTDATGASFKQEGTTVTFTGSNVRAGASLAFEFEVAGDARLGAKGPDSCQVDNAPCGAAAG
ncbi:SRPBCC domain-containing protein [Micromonospora sp. CPCC 206061]|uniref:SRPBCC domain-containing protein n=1 Tax=Micromonospora sp. CPCC 206061 TaxID=3122410 RepID=UPI002FEE7AB2